jgi:uncharacterized cysteine cluster protein YcgN (CxxCxxCC family)
MIDEKVCGDCPTGIRGYCCYLNAMLGGHNVILENQPCPHLDKVTHLCGVYNERHEKAPWCNDVKDMYGQGALPKGCLYLKGKEHLEPHPKVFIKDIIKDLDPVHIGIFNTVNNIPFEVYTEIMANPDLDNDGPVITKFWDDIKQSEVEE